MTARRSVTRDCAEHWDAVFATKANDEVSWFEESHDTSVSLLATQPGAMLDVGAGAGTLADELLADGRTDVTLLDISREALAVVSERLGPDEQRVHYVVTDLLSWRPERQYDAWHDRAVFHFLADPADQASYVDLAARTLFPGGLLVLAAFGPDGPTTCSGLPTVRHSADDLTALFAPSFSITGSELRVHHTPQGAEQQFVWVWMRRAPV